MEVRHLAYRVASRYLLSKDRYQRETGQSLPRWKQVLDEYEASGNNFVHFSFVPKLGVYPNNKFNTPTGFYSYPLKYARISNFATDRPYAVIFKVKPGANVLLLSQYGEEDLQRDLSILQEKFSGIPREVLGKLIEKAQRDAPGGLPGAKLWYFTRNLSEELGGRFVHKWAWILWKVLGYDGVYDDRGKKIIHRDEPYQAVFFNTRVLDLKDLLQLYTPKLNEYGEVVPEGEGSAKFLKQRSEQKKSIKSLPNDSYIGEDLSGLYFPSLNLAGKDFTGADFSGSEFFNTKLTGTKLTGANLSYAAFRGANLTGVILTGANLTGATLNKERLMGVDLSKAILVGTYLRAANLLEANLSGAILRGADLEEAEVARANLAGADLRAANLLEANLSRAILTGANFWGTDLTGVKFWSADLSKADLKGANLGGSDLGGSDLTDANLTGANLTGANLMDVNLTGANLTGADLTGANLSDANLTGANLTGAVLDGANLTGAVLPSI